MLTLFASLTCKNYQKSRPAENAQATESSNKEESTSSDFNKIKHSESELSQNDEKIKSFEIAFEYFLSKCVHIMKKHRKDKRRIDAECTHLDKDGNTYDKMCDYNLLEGFMDIKEDVICKQLFKEAVEKNPNYAMQKLNGVRSINKLERYVDSGCDAKGYIQSVIIDYLIDEYHKNKDNNWILDQIFEAIRNHSDKLKEDTGYEYYDDRQYNTSVMDLMIIEQPQKYIDFFSLTYNSAMYRHSHYTSRCPDIVRIIHRYEALLNQNADKTVLEAYEKFIHEACRRTRFDLNWSQISEWIGSSYFIKAMRSEGII